MVSNIAMNMHVVHSYINYGFRWHWRSLEWDHEGQETMRSVKICDFVDSHSFCMQLWIRSDRWTVGTNTSVNHSNHHFSVNINHFSITNHISTLSSPIPNATSSLNSNYKSILFGDFLSDFLLNIFPRLWTIETSTWNPVPTNNEFRGEIPFTLTTIDRKQIMWWTEKTEMERTKASEGSWYHPMSRDINCVIDGEWT